MNLNKGVIYQLAQKDLRLKEFLEQKDVFADIFNALLYHKPGYIDPNDLEPAPTHSIADFLDDAEAHEQIRDIVMHHKKDGHILHIIDLENESYQSADEVFKLFGYVGIIYFQQYRRRYKDPSIPRYPVVTLVLNFSGEKWRYPTSLYNLLNIQPGSTESFGVSDFRIDVVDMGFLKPLDLLSLGSDFQAFSALLNELFSRDTTVLDMCNFSNFAHAKEMLAALDAFDQEHQVWNRIEKLRGGDTEMEFEGLFRVLEERGYTKKWEQRGMQQGVQQGVQQGAQDMLERNIQAIMQNLNCDRARACEILNISTSTGTEDTTCSRGIKKLNFGG